MSINPSTKNPMLSDKAYKVLEYLARIVIPALGTLYAALGALWGLSYTAQVVGTLVAIDTFLGAFLGLAMRSYDASDAAYNGTIEVTPNPEGPTTYSLTLNSQPEALTTMDKVVFKVNSP